tara:strand:+ start:654 stop:1193 length:540 start_codon:yes stop_codon:yes gene_type:complete
MQINTLYIHLKEVKGGFYFIQQVKAKHARYIERNGHPPKYGRHGYYSKRLKNDEELQDSIEQLSSTIEYRIDRLLGKNKNLRIAVNAESNPYWDSDAYRFRTARCQLLCALTALCRAIAIKDRANREVSLYHINTHWLALNRIVHGDDVQYKNAQNIAMVGNFIPMKDRFYGKRRRPTT